MRLTFIPTSVVYREPFDLLPGLGLSRQVGGTLRQPGRLRQVPLPNRNSGPVWTLVKYRHRYCGMQTVQDYNKLLTLRTSAHSCVVATALRATAPGTRQPWVLRPRSPVSPHSLAPVHSAATTRQPASRLNPGTPLSQCQRRTCPSSPEYSRPATACSPVSLMHASKGLKRLATSTAHGSSYPIPFN